MEPGLRPGQCLLVRSLRPDHNPQRGEIVVFRLPGECATFNLKRVIGVPGDLLKAEEGLLFLNGAHAAEPYLSGGPAVFGLDERWDLTLGANQFHVMGDNRPHSTDSRHFGPVTRGMIVGKAVARLWPPALVGNRTTQARLSNGTRSEMRFGSLR